MNKKPYNATDVELASLAAPRRHAFIGSAPCTLPVGVTATLRRAGITDEASCALDERGKAEGLSDEASRALKVERWRAESLTDAAVRAHNEETLRLALPYLTTADRETIDRLIDEGRYRLDVDPDLLVYFRPDELGQGLPPGKQGRKPLTHEQKAAYYRLWKRERHRYPSERAFVDARLYIGYSTWRRIKKEMEAQGI